MESLTPVMDKKRYACPFYGFYMAPGALLDTEGNQCALLTDSYSPCQMQVYGELPNFGACPTNTEEKRKSIEAVSDHLMVFPKEFKPKGNKSWEGISFKEWQEYVIQLSA